MEATAVALFLNICSGIILPYVATQTLLILDLGKVDNEIQEFWAEEV